MTVFTTETEEQTIALGEQVGSSLKRPAVVLLIGQLGAGKTTLAKGIVKGLGAADPNDVSSPTFTLIHDYGHDVFHIDLYRLDAWSEVESLGLEELFDKNGIVVIEWGERFSHLAARATMLIRLTAVGNTRQIEVTEP